MLQAAPDTERPSATAAPRGYRVGDLTIDLGTRRVFREGRDLGVTRLSFDLLLALVRASPDLLTYEALIAQVWPGMVVSPETLTQRIKLLRRALADNAEDPRYILAVRGVGYRLSAVVEMLASPDSAALPTRTEAAPVLRRPSLRVATVLASALLLAAGTWWYLRPVVPEATVNTDTEAYRYFQQAEGVVNGTPESFQAAVSLYTEALRYNPAYAAAWSGRAMNRAALVWVGSSLARGLEEARADAEQALRLDEREVRAHLVLASIHAMQADWLGAERSFAMALASGRDDAEVLARQAASLLLPVGQLQKAAVAARTASSLRPDSGFSSSILAFVELSLGGDEATRLAERAIAQGGDPRQMAAVLAIVAARQGRIEVAIAQAQRALPPSVRQAGGDAALQTAFTALADPSRKTAALAALRELVRGPAWETADPRSRQVVLYLLARFDAFDDLYGELQRMTQSVPGRNPQIIAVAGLWLPEMRSFRRDARFQELVQSLNLMKYWRHSGPPDGCHLVPALDCDR